MEHIFDTHAHYTSHRISPEERARLLAWLPSQGVQYLLEAGCDLPGSRTAIELAEQYDYVYAAAGIHPEELDDLPDDFIDELAVLLRHPKVVAVGETGLDYYYDENASHERQQTVFAQQLMLAKDTGMPIIIHSRDAIQDTYDLVRRYQPTGIVHCYSGSWEMAQEFLKLGLYIGFTGVVTFKNAKRILKVAKEIPLDRILLETDCPFMAPEPYRGQPSNSAMIAYTAQAIADIKGIDVQMLIDHACENALRVYRIKP